MILNGNMFDSAIIHLEMGKVYESLGDTEKALSHYRSSAELLLKRTYTYY